MVNIKVLILNNIKSKLRVNVLFLKMIDIFWLILKIIINNILDLVSFHFLFSLVS